MLHLVWMAGCPVRGWSWMDTLADVFTLTDTGQRLSWQTQGPNFTWRTAGSSSQPPPRRKPAWSLYGRRKDGHSEPLGNLPATS